MHSLAHSNNQKPLSTLHPFLHSQTLQKTERETQLKGMTVSFFISHITPLTFFCFLLLSSSAAADLNITSTLSSFQNLTSFSSLLTSSSVASNLTRRQDPITLLAVPNSYLSIPPSSDLTHRLPLSSLGDILRYHVLLHYLLWIGLLQIPPSGVFVTTLLQTTSRAPANFGAVNITRNPLTNSITIQSPVTFSLSNAIVLSLINTLPYNITILAVDSLLIPYDFNLMTSETRPLGLNITKALIDSHNFNVAAAMLSASSVVDEFEAGEDGAGITLFVPTDGAFGDLPGNVRLHSLPADKKSMVLKFHVLHSYYPLGSLESIVNPVQPTLATEDNSVGSFTLNISRVNESVEIDTRIVQASKFLGKIQPG
ncbi:fasciclin-like arabinogalactan protein 4 [Gossypium australe]|uniref:Fasciclin-like arabinogalactan protein 4 n=1 Tax=Gossypium australe TaxID=47621 RepID=A0A5B6UIM4_9ROSI|nr:fasciclin-like arabinogalactan protein 4 [Gossypium australe]